MCENLLLGRRVRIMNAKWIKKVSLGALTVIACLGVANSAPAQSPYYGHHHAGCAPRVGFPNYGYRPITTLPYYGSNYGVGGYSSNYGGYNNFGGYNNNFGGYNNNFGGYNNFGGFPRGASFGGGSFPIGGSYGGGSFPRGGSYGGGSFPRGGSYGGGGFPLYMGR